MHNAASPQKAFPSQSISSWHGPPGGDTMVSGFEHQPYFRKPFACVTSTAARHTSPVWHPPLLSPNTVQRGKHSA
jgi:hypothetical protein